VLVGLNAYQDDQREQKIPVFKTNPETERRQVKRLQDLRKQRDNDRVQQTLADMVDAARASENLLPALIPAVKAYATLGEICEALRGVYGTYVASQII
jgi:methylmalonyl-CoA mutase N-terminal domain/subunit